MSYTTYSAADIPISASGRIYHLDLKPDELADRILIVGDPERVTMIAEEFLETIEVDRWHRGLHSVTGHLKGRGQARVSLITSGMGTGSLEIVLQELVLLNEIDFGTRRRKERFSPFAIIRVGTCGGLQAERALGTHIISRYAIGLDNTGLFYDAPPADDYCVDLERRVKDALDCAFSSAARFRGSVYPYVSAASPQVVASLANAARELGVRYVEGITVSNSGFFAPQGRDTSRIAPSLPDLDRVLANLDCGHHRSNHKALQIENMEMESSFLLHFMSGLGYPVGAICPAIANRALDTFAQDIPSAIREATHVALAALQVLR